MSMMSCAMLAQTAAEPRDSVSNVKLPDVVVKGKTVKHKHNGELYTVTDELRKSSADCMELLGRLPGVRYESLTGNLTVMMNSNVLLTVDGVERTKDYIASLPMKKVKSVEVVTSPTGRHLAQGYRYVVNIRLHNDYSGYDLNLSNTSMLDLGGNNGSDFIANEQPSAMVAHTNRKWDFDVKYGHASIRWNYPITYEKRYNGILSLASADYTTKSPNEHFTNFTNALSGGLTYRIDKKQNLTLRFNHTNEDIATNDVSAMTATDLGTGSQTSYREDKLSSDKTPNNKLSLFYQARLGKLDIYADVSYNNRRSKSANTYRLSSGFFDESLHRNRKDYLRSTLDFNYTLSELSSLNFGYFGVWNRYSCRSLADNALIARTREQRHNVYAAFDRMMSQKLMLTLGLAAEYNHRQGETKHYMRLLPKASLTYFMSENAVFTLDYNTATQYPLQYQMAGASYMVDSLMRYSSNPSLRQTTSHNIALQGALWEKLQLGVQYTIAHNDITPLYHSDGGRNVQTFVNGNTRMFGAVATYDWSITDKLLWENSVQFRYMRRAANGLHNHSHSWVGASRLNYIDSNAGLTASLEYSKGLYREPLLQGFQEYSQDYWQLSLTKKLLKNRFTASLNYILPVSAGVHRYQKSCVETSFHREATSLNTKTYDNILMVRLRYNLHIGKKAKKTKQRSVFEDENKRDRGLL